MPALHHFISGGDDGGVRYDDSFLNPNGKRRPEIGKQVVSVEFGYGLILALGGGVVLLVIGGREKGITGIPQ